LQFHVYYHLIAPITLSEHPYDLASGLCRPWTDVSANGGQMDYRRANNPRQFPCDR
jgi:hypothetical protein